MTLNKIRKFIYDNRVGLIIIGLAFFFLLYSNYGAILRFFLRGRDDVVIFDPVSIWFDTDGERISEFDDYDKENCENGYDEFGVYHFYVYPHYNLAKVSVLGELWNYPFLPEIKIDGVTIKHVWKNNISSTLEGNVWNDLYIKYAYGFDFENLQTNHQYTITIVCEKFTRDFKIVFHDSLTQ